jgi:hypothetical protein
MLHGAMPHADRPRQVKALSPLSSGARLQASVKKWVCESSVRRSNANCSCMCLEDVVCPRWTGFKNLARLHGTHIM